MRFWKTAENFQYIPQKRFRGYLRMRLETTWVDWIKDRKGAPPGTGDTRVEKLLAEAGVRIKSIAESRLEELSGVLERTLASDETTREMNGPKPLTLSVQSLAAQLEEASLALQEVLHTSRAQVAKDLEELQRR
jgi:hypothetical protein